MKKRKESTQKSLTLYWSNGDAVRSHLTGLAADYLEKGGLLDGIRIEMSLDDISALIRMRNALGDREFPLLTRAGGDLFGIPVVVKPGNFVGSWWRRVPRSRQAPVVGNDEQ